MMSSPRCCEVVGFTTRDFNQDDENSLPSEMMTPPTICNATSLTLESYGTLDDRAPVSISLSILLQWAQKPILMCQPSPEML